MPLQNQNFEAAVKAYQDQKSKLEQHAISVQNTMTDQMPDEKLEQIISACVRCDDMYTDKCDQVVYQRDKVRQRFQLVPDELIKDKDMVPKSLQQTKAAEKAQNKKRELVDIESMT